MRSGPGTVLFRALESARFTYAVRHLPDGTPYAGFRWSAAGLPLMSFTALEQGGALRITVHDIGDAGGSGGERWRLGTRVPLARVHRSPETGQVEVTAAFDVAGGSLDTGAWTRLLEHVALSARHLTGKLAGPPGLPPSPPGAAPAEVLEILRREGLDPAAAGEAARFERVLPGLGVRGRFEVDAPCAGWVRAQAELEGGPGLPAERPDLADRLQWWAPVGRFVLSPSGGIAAQVVSPLLGRELRGVLGQALSGVQRLLGTAYKHVTGAGGRGAG